MPNLKVKNPAERFDLAYLFANGSVQEIKELAQVAKEVSARCAMVHVADVATLASELYGSSVRPEVVIDFPDGLGGFSAKDSEAFSALKNGAVAGDTVVNLRYVAERNKDGVVQECQAVKSHLSEVKLICQIPYLWQFDRAAIDWLLDLLPEAGVYCAKDWTTRQNFLIPAGQKLDTATETRVRYTEYMANYITTHNLPLFVKIAGGVDAANARAFVNAGADFLGLSYGKAKAIYEVLL
ncbi:MAG: hypothetical protein Q7R94_02145 [bacterium]|nr:hypothetical protein [bacterium]